MTTPIEIEYINMPFAVPFEPNTDTTSPWAEFPQENLTEGSNITNFRLLPGSWKCQLVWNGPESINLNVAKSNKNYPVDAAIPAGTGQRTSPLIDVTVKSGEILTLRVWVSNRTSTKTGNPDVRGTILCYPTPLAGTTT